MTSETSPPPRAEQANVTNAPIDEHERQATRDRERAERSPFPWIALAGMAVLIGIAIVAGATAGWAYAIAVGVLAVVVAIFVGGQRVLGAMSTDRQAGTGRAEEAAADDGSDPISHLSFDEQSQRGSTAQLPDEDRPPTRRWSSRRAGPAGGGRRG